MRPLLPEDRQYEGDYLTTISLNIVMFSLALAAVVFLFVSRRLEHDRNKSDDWTALVALVLTMRRSLCSAW